MHRRLRNLQQFEPTPSSTAFIPVEAAAFAPRYCSTEGSVGLKPQRNPSDLPIYPKVRSGVVIGNASHATSSQAVPAANKSESPQAAAIQCCVKGCARPTWNGKAKQACCRTCYGPKGQHHGPSCVYKIAAVSSASAASSTHHYSHHIILITFSIFILITFFSIHSRHDINGTSPSSTAVIFLTGSGTK